MFQKFLASLLAHPVTMIDLETLDVKPSAIVMSAAAIVFDFKRMKTLRTYEATLDIESQIAAHRTASTSTLQWWLGSTSDGARSAITRPRKSAQKNILPERCCADLKLVLPQDGLVIAKPAMFDLPILNDLFQGDWYKYRRAFDMQTMLTMVDPDRAMQPKNNVHHDALEDCRWQLAWLVNVVMYMDLFLSKCSTEPPFFTSVIPDLYADGEQRPDDSVVQS